MDDDDVSLFRKSVGDLSRIRDDRVEQWRPPRAARRRPPDDSTRPRPPPHSEPPSMPQADDGYRFRRGGVQDRLYRSLRRGELGGRALDLHGMTRDEAFAALDRFIDRARREGARAARIIHGKGYRSQDGRAVLRPSVPAWLRQMPAVLAFCPAMPADGGDGALYVLLKRARGGV